MSKWQEYQLGQLYNVSSGLSKAADQFGFGYVFISFKDVFWNFFLPDSPNGLVNSDEKDQKSCSVLKGDVLLTRTSESLEEVGMSSVALKDYDKSTFNGFCKRLRIKKEAPIKVSPLYIGYLLRTRFFRKSVANYATMTTRASLNSESIKSIPLPFPDFIIQEKIGITLYNLDKKISLLHQQNQTLEELAQTLFKRWFAEFEFPNEDGDPYRSSGGIMVDSEIGEIPVGWGIKTIRDFITKYNTGADAIQKAPIVEYNTGIRCIRIGDLSNSKQFNDWGYTKISPEHFEQFRLLKDDIIITRTSILGLSYLIMENLNAVFNNGSIRIRPKEGYAQYLYACLNSIDFKKHIMKITHETSTRPNMKIDYLLIYDVIDIPDNILLSFTGVYQSLLNKHDENLKEIQILIQLRDSLLPKLMNGKIQIRP